MRALIGRLAPRLPGEGLTADCVQCGRDRVDVVALTRRGARISCRACGAVATLDRSRVRAVFERRDQPPAPAEPAPEATDPLAAYVSADLLAWARATGRDRRAAGLDKATIYRLWKEFDRVHPAADPEGAGRLPSFGEVVGLLHSNCYDEAAVVAGLLGDSADAERAVAVAERVGCARRWLAGPGREHCWIERRADGEAVDADALRTLLTEDALAGQLDTAQRQALFVAAFGASGGPTARALVERFGAAGLLAALEGHLRDGSHPLRPAVLAALDARAPGDGFMATPAVETAGSC
jgi:hypothetical protein